MGLINKARIFFFSCLKTAQTQFVHIVSVAYVAEVFCYGRVPPNLPP